MTSRVVFIVCVLLCVLLMGWGGVQEASAYSFCYQDTNGRLMHWKRSKFPLNVVLHKDGCATVPEAQLLQVLGQVFGVWNAIDCTYARLTGGAKAPADNAPVVDGINMIKFVKEGQDWQWGTAELLVPILTTDTRSGEIRDADLLLNSWKFSFSTTPKDGEYDLQAVLTHGVGRILALCDSTDSNATMYGAINPTETGKRILGDDDRKGICDLYPKDSPCQEGELIGNDSVCFNGRVSPVCPAYSPICQTCRSSPDCRGERNHCLFAIDEGRCGMECGVGGACPKGYNCITVNDDMGMEIAKNCAPDTSSCTNAPPIPCCRSSEDCLPGFSCDLQQCKRGAITDPCQGRCAVHEQCDNGTCVARGCKGDTECGVGWKCVNSRCSPSSGCDGGCPPGQACQSGACVAVGGTACTNDGDCSVGLKCALGGGIRLCTSECNSPQGCADGFFCVSGLSGVTSQGCWPATRAVCDANNACKAVAKGTGGCSGCAAFDSPPMIEAIFLFLLVFLRLSSRSLRAR